MQIPQRFITDVVYVSCKFFLLLIRWIIFCSEWVVDVQSGARRSLVHSLRNEKNPRIEQNDEYTFIFILLKHIMTDAKYDLITFRVVFVAKLHVDIWETGWCLSPRKKKFCLLFGVVAFVSIYITSFHRMDIVRGKEYFLAVLPHHVCCVSRWFSVPCYTCHTTNLQINEGFSFQYEIYAIIWD